MKSIIGQKSGMIGKLIIYQIAMSLFGLFVISPFQYTMHIYASIFSLLFYFSLVCYAVIEDGQRDCVSASSGRSDGKAYTGLLYSLVSYLPTIIVTLLNMILRLFTIPEAFGVLKTILEKLLMRVFLMGMYLGFDTGLAPRAYANGEQIRLSSNNFMYYLSDNGIIFTICLFIMPIVCGAAYYLAFKGKIHVDTTPKKERTLNKKKNND